VVEFDDLHQNARHHGYQNGLRRARARVPKTIDMVMHFLYVRILILRLFSRVACPNDALLNVSILLRFQRIDEEKILDVVP
jgi:hypothetical protein